MASLPLPWIEALFAKFSAFYGAQFAQKWAGSNLDQVKTEWADALGRFEGLTLKAAVEHCRDNVQFPPSLPEFVTICKSQRVRPEHQLFLPHNFTKSDKGAEILAGIKAMLKKGQPT
jgi:hypothetical protein